MGLFDKRAPAAAPTRSQAAGHDCGCGASFGSQQELMAHAQKYHAK